MLTNEKEVKTRERARGWLLALGSGAIVAGIYGASGWPYASIGMGVLILSGLLFGLRRR